MFEWLKKGSKNGKVLHHAATDDVYKIIHLFSLVNDITIYEIDDIVRKIGLIYPNASIFEKKPIEIADDIWNEQGYIGSIEFDKEIFDTYNSSNDYAKNIYKDANTHFVLNHVIHLCKDGVILELNYKYNEPIYGDITKIRRRIYFKLNKKDNDYEFVKNKEHLQMNGRHGSLIIKNEESYVREQIHDNIIRLTFIKGDGKKLVIEISKDKEQFIEFVDEKQLVTNILYSNFELPSIALKYMIEYFEKNNINVSFINVRNIVSGWKISRELVYEDYKENNTKKVSLLEKKTLRDDIDESRKPTLKTLNIYNTYEDGKSVRVIEVDAKNTARMVLKVTMDNNSAYIPNETQLINYLLKEFPHMNISGYPNFSKIDVLFHNISATSFSNISDDLCGVELSYYKGEHLMGTKEWKKHTFEEEGPVLKRK